MKIAVIGGTGDEGHGLALRWVKAGYDVIIGSRAAERAESTAKGIEDRLEGGSVSGLDNPAAAAAADVVVVTVPYSGQAVIYRSIADHIGEQTVVVDCTVPVAASVGGKATHTLGVWQGSAAQQALSLLPRKTLICAAFHSLAAVALEEVDSALEGDVLVAGTKQAKETVKELVEAIPGLRYMDAGPLENARLIEPLTSLLIGINHRYGTDRSGIRITGI
jgi:NADPH-dependent F420 reductase